MCLEKKKKNKQNMKIKKRPKQEWKSLGASEKTKKAYDLANRNVLTQVRKKSFENFWRERFLN